MALPKMMLALMGKGKGPAVSSSKDDKAAGASPHMSGDYKQIAKDAAKDGDWDAMIDALCSCFENDKD